MAFAGIAFLAGILFALQQTALSEPEFLAGLVLAAAALFFYRLTRPVAFVLLGFTWATLFAHWQLQHTLPIALEGETITVVGRVAGLPEENARRVRFLFDIERIQHGETHYVNPLRTRISWYRSPQTVSVGERWQLTVRLKRPHGFSNPGGFDYERWLFKHGIRATGYVVPAAVNQQLGSAGSVYPIQQLRQYVAEHIARSAAGLKNQATLRALAIGDRSQISRSDWRSLVETGTNHLFAISGLHIGLIAVLAYGLARRFWLWSPLMQTHLSRQQFSCCTAIAVALAYAALAGFALPTQRALLMLLVPAIALLTSRKIPAGSGFFAALLLVLFFDPMAPLSPGFWLSFGAVGIILLRLAGRVGRSHWLDRMIWLQLALAVGLSPLLLIHFAQVPLASALANVIAVPWVSVVVVPLTLLGTAASLFSATLGAWVFYLSDASIGVFWFVLRHMAASDWLPVVSLSVSTVTLMLIVIAAVLLLLPRFSRVRVLALFLSLPLLFADHPVVRPGDLRIAVLDVGQGLSVIVKTARHAMVYDTGKRFSETFDAGDAVVVPALRSYGIGCIDTLIVSHTDLDHRGGLVSIQRQLPVDRLLSSNPIAIGGDAELCRTGQSWRWDGIQFDILSPAADTDLHGSNNRSCVLRISAKGMSVLLPGDIEQEAESALLAENVVRADILVAPRHGSATSSTQAFIDAVKPRHVVYPVGYRNQFGFPKAEVQKRYRAAGTKEWRSDQHGAVVFDWSSATSTWSVYAYRNENKRFWHSDAIGSAFTRGTE